MSEGPRIPPSRAAPLPWKARLLRLVAPQRDAEREIRGFAGQLDEALQAVRGGELAKAHDLFWDIAEKARSPELAAAARHGLGWTMMLQGDLDNAAAVLSDNETRFVIAHRLNNISASTAVDLALVHGLRGDVRQAEMWLHRAHARRSLSVSSSIDATIAFSRSVWLCRSGRSPEAAKLLDDGWAGYEAALTGDVLRPLRVVRAFAHATGPRSGGVAAAALPTLRPAYPGEYTYLGTKWPEMAVFLATHELA